MTISRGPRGFFCLQDVRRGPVNVDVIPPKQSLSENPYQPPNSTDETRWQNWQIGTVVSYLVNCTVLGALLSVGALFFYANFMLVPLWEGQIYKGDERWETIFFIAGTVLPIATIAGILSAAIVLRFTSFRFRHKGLLWSCLGLWFMITSLRPVVSRIRRPGVPNPDYETIPDSMGLIVVVLFVAVACSAIIGKFQNRSNRQVDPSVG